MGYSSQNSSSTAQTLTLQFFGGFSYTAPTFTSPTAATAQSIYVAGSVGSPVNINVNANDAWYGNVVANVDSTPDAKGWIFIIFYSQR